MIDAEQLERNVWEIGQGGIMVCPRGLDWASWGTADEVCAACAHEDEDADCLFVVNRALVEVGITEGATAPLTAAMIAQDEEAGRL